MPNNKPAIILTSINAINGFIFSAEISNIKSNKQANNMSSINEVSYDIKIKANSMSKQENKAILIMGVSGVGKTTIGKLLAEATGLSFYDGDDYHSSANVAKMAAGNALTDIDRQEWLEKLHELLQTQLTRQGCILACSALKEKYREVLASNLANVNFVYLQGSYQEVLKRLEERKGHYMKADLLQSQFDILEEPTNALTISIQLSVEEIVATIVKHFSLSTQFKTKQ